MEKLNVPQSVRFRKCLNRWVFDWHHAFSDCVKARRMYSERFFISFSPGFNRVISGLSILPKPFQRFTFRRANQKPLKRFEQQKTT